MTSDFSMFYEKMSDFVWFPLFVLTLVIKTLIFDQKKKKKISDLNMFCQTVTEWIMLRCLNSILLISWEIQISNFIEIV